MDDVIPHSLAAEEVVVAAAAADMHHWSVDMVDWFCVCFFGVAILNDDVRGYPHWVSSWVSSPIGLKLAKSRQNPHFPYYSFHSDNASIFVEIQQECTRWNVSPVLIISWIMLKVYNMKCLQKVSHKIHISNVLRKCIHSQMNHVGEHARQKSNGLQIWLLRKYIFCYFQWNDYFWLLHNMYMCK